MFLLVQHSAAVQSRVFYDFSSLNECLEFVVRLYEDHLAVACPGALTYEMTELFLNIETFTELFVLLYNDRLQAYLPHDRRWLKQQVYQWLSAQASIGTLT